MYWHIKLNMKNVLKELKDKKLEKGEIIARHLGPVTVVKWCDKRSVTVVSTCDRADTQRVSNKGKETEKPLCVIDCNHNMGGVDLKDLHMYMVERKKMTKWYRRLFKRLLNSTVLSSFIVYRQVMGRNYRSSHIEFSWWKVCLRNMRVLRRCKVYRVTGIGL